MTPSPTSPGPSVVNQVITAATFYGHVNHQPGCEWICGRPVGGYPEYWCVCLNPRFRKGKERRVCKDCGASEHPASEVAR